MRDFVNAYFHHLGIKIFRTVSNTIQTECPPKTLFIVYIGHKKPFTYLWLYFTYLTRAHIHQKQVGCRAPFSIFSSTLVFYCRLVLKSLLQDLLYTKNNNIVLSIQFFHNQLALLKAFQPFSYSVHIENKNVENLKNYA